MPGPEALAGGCLCGALRYSVEAGAELCVYCCHCRDCQRASSSAFAILMVAPEAAFTLLTGTPKSALRRADSGRQIEGFFCADCGTRLYDRSADYSEVLVVRAGTIDVSEGLMPVAQFWTSRKRSWVSLPEDQLIDPRQPDGFDAVIALYKSRQARRASGPGNGGG